MKREKIHTFATLSVGIVAAGLIALVLIRYFLPAVLPFLIAWAVAFAVRPIAAFVSSRTRLPERILRVALAIVGTLLLFVTLFFALRECIFALWRFLSELGEGDAIYDLITELSSPTLPIFGDVIPDELARRIGDALHGLLTSALSAIGSAVTGFAAAIPRAVLFLVVTVIAVVYFTLDLEGINRAVRGVLPRAFSDRLSTLRREIFTVGAKYLGSYLLIMLITFSIMLTGLLLLRIRGALIIAAIVAFLDVLPVIGVGTVLVPWSIVELASGNTYVGISLLILLLVNEVVRQLAEPRIVGKNLGIHPLLTLVMIYAGYSLFGVLGLLLIPVVPALLGLLGKHKKSAVSEETQAPRDR